MRRVDRGIRAEVSARLRSTLNPEWQRLLPQHLTGLPQEAMLVKGARIAAGNPPQIVAANSRRKVGRDLIPSEAWPAWEYGAGGHDKRTYRRRNRGGTGTHEVTRDTRAGLPSYRKGGRVIGPAVKAFLPRATSFWVQSVVRAFMDAAEGKG